MSSTDNRAPQLVAVTAAFLVLVIFSIVLRVFTRLRVVKWLGIDDWLMVCAVVAAIVESAAVIIGKFLRHTLNYVLTSSATKHGMGKHIDQQPLEWRKPYGVADLIASLAYSSSAMFVKLSLLTFYLRLAPNDTFLALTYILIFVCTCFGVGSILAAALQCIPVSMLWDPNQAGHCIDVNSFYFANAGIHILTELFIYILPIPTLWRLHLPLRQKLGLCGLMSIGAG
jgi:hypothetical protein